MTDMSVIGAKKCWGIIAEELRRRGWLWGYASVVSVDGITFNV